MFCKGRFILYDDTQMFGLQYLLNTHIFSINNVCINDRISPLSSQNAFGRRDHIR